MDHYDNQSDVLETISTNWIEGLALEELNMEQSGVINFKEHLNVDQLLEESSITFMDNLRELFEIYVQKFNSYRCQNEKVGNGQIKIFKISSTVNDFMLYRNSLKLVVARKSASTISLGMLSNTGGLFAARINAISPPEKRPHEIKAYIGPFNEIVWQFRDRPVNINNLVKHYLTEFIKHSAR